MLRITDEQTREAVGHLAQLAAYHPATDLNEYDLGRCLYCGAKVANLNSMIIHHRKHCPWAQARDFVSGLPLDWDEEVEGVPPGDAGDVPGQV